MQTMQTKKKSGLWVLTEILALSLVFALGVTACGGDDDGAGDDTIYTVTFNLNGATGTPPTAQKVADGGKVSEPTAPTWSGYNFGGWFRTATPAAGTQAWAFATDTVTGDITLYAKWTATGSDETTITDVVSGTFDSLAGDNKLTVTLTGGTFVTSPTLAQFTISTAGTGGFANLTGGTVTRTSSTVVTITGLTAVTTAGSGQKITVAAAAQATQATSATVTASGSGSAGSTVTGVTVTADGLYAPKGGTLQFHATVDGTGSPSPLVSWSITSPASVASGTSIDADGLLSIDAAESSNLIIRATSRQDTSKYAGRYVSVQAENTKAISSVSVSGSLLEVGRTLEVSSVWDSSYDYVTDATFQWKRASTETGTYTDISGATSVTYTLTTADVDKYIKVEAKNAATPAGKLSSANGPVYAVLSAISSVTLSGITAPVKGNALATTFTAPANIVNSLGGSSISILWYEETSPGSGSFSYSSSGNAEAGTRYQAAIFLYPAAGYKFGEDVTINASTVDATYNGNGATNGIGKSSLNETYMSLYLYFPATAE